MSTPKWNNLTRDQQDLYVKILWEDAYSHNAIAVFLGTSKGTIVGRQQRHPNLAPTIRTKADRAVNPERFCDLLDLYALEERAGRKKRRS